MKNTRKLLCALAVAYGGALPGQVYGGEDNWAASQAPAVAVANASWDYDPNAPVPPADTTEAKKTSVTSGAAGSCSSACDYSCCCDDPERSLYAMVEGTFFFPQFHRDFLAASYVNPNTGGPVDVLSTAALGSTDGSLNVAPRITLGVQGEKWGVLVRYWNATSTATAFTPANPLLTPAGITLFDSFQAYTFDLELQRRGRVGAWDLYGFGGIRYASVNNDRNLNVASFGQLVLGAGDTFTTSFASQQFNGTGLTFGFWGARPLGCSPLKLFVANRYSMLWGTGSAVAQTSATAGLAATSTNGAIASNDSSLFIGEVQVGLQWEAQLECLPGRAFVRSGLEYQYWDTNGGIFAASASTANALFAGSLATASAGDLLFSLIGFNIGAGILY